MRSLPSSPNSWSGRPVPRRLSLPLVPTNEFASAMPLAAPAATAAPTSNVASLFTICLTRRRGGGCGGGRWRVASATDWRWRERRRADHQREGEQPERELELIARQRLAEDHWTGGDRAEVRGGARHGDDRNRVADLETAGRDGEPDKRCEEHDE